MAERSNFWVGLHYPRLARKLSATRKWWESYGPKTAADKVEALGDACAWWQEAHRLAIEERNERQAAIDRALALMRDSEYVGGPTEREARRGVLAALGPFETSRTGQGPPA
jgi:hypothetical protein